MTISKPQLHPLEIKPYVNVSTNYWQFSQNSWKVTKSPDGGFSSLVIMVIKRTIKRYFEEELKN
jgi:hypothetical protein